MAGSFTRRDFLKITAGTGAGIVVAACSSTPGASSAPPAASSAAPAASSAAPAASSAAPSAAASTAPGPLNFLTWSDHWSKDEVAGVKEATGIEVNLAEWLYEKTLGHPYFLAFISRELLALPNRAPSDVWHEIATHLEREKFHSDLAHLSDKDVALLRALARTDEHEVSPTPFVKQFQYEYFRRLTERGLLIRSGRGRYKLYHPLFRQFLQQQE